MPKAILLIFLLATFTTKALAIEPILDQQAMIYLNVSFDAGHKKTSTYKYGFRFDRGLIKPGEAIEMSQLFTRPAVFNLGLNKYGIKAFFSLSYRPGATNFQNCVNIIGLEINIAVKKETFK